jgi:2-methylcitrate synthase
MSEEPEIHYGLAGVVVDKSAISKVMPEINSLVYRGYPVQDLAEHCSFEEVAWLIWHGDLPNAGQLATFQREVGNQRDLSDDLLAVIQRSPRGAHPMDVLRTAVSFLGSEDPDLQKSDPEINRKRSIRMMAKIPTIIAAFYRHRKGEEFIPPRSDLGFVENFFHMVFGNVPAPEILKTFDVSLILYAEHGFNASTFTTRVIVSSVSDIYSGVVGGIASLKGPLHGGANEAVMQMLLEIGDAARAEDWMRAALREKRVVMGFGHRVYKHGDSRVPTMKKYARRMAGFTGQTLWLDIEDVLEKVMLEEKGIHPNLDFPSGPAYHMMGFDIDMFTPFFVMARVTGWTAHILEQQASNRLIRPLCAYTGPGERRVPPLEERG